MLEQLDSQIAAALGRVHAVADQAAERAHAERREMLEFARRSIGQRIRWARCQILGPVYVPAVFCWRNFQCDQ